MECPIVKISVRNLVEFILRSGDIDNRIGKMADKDAMQLGSKIHRKIQRQMGADYHAEVSLKHQISYENCILQIEGRADGIIIDENQVVIDEIKGILGELERLEEPKEVHLAQAKCYACIYGLQEGLEEIGVQMTYCQMETEEIRRFQYTYSVQNLAAWFSDIADQYQKWAKFQIDWREKRNASIRTIEFPFVYREGQRELVRDVYRTILRKKQLFIQAPTGVGKTMATVFPAVKAIGEGLGEKLFYLTAKTITRTVAENAFQTLKQQGLNMKVITLTAKEKICFCETMECNPEACPYAKGHFDRVNDAVFELLNETGEMTREALERQARKHQVCPFEMSLDVASWVDAVICDYNYVFDPTAHLKRFFSEGGSGQYLFLIDEAHNLVERAREMYSAVLYKEDVLEAKRLARYEAPKLAKKLDLCNRQLLEMKRECESYQVHQSVSHIYLSAMNIMAELEKIMENPEKGKLREDLLDFYFQIRTFVNIYDQIDEHYVIYTEMQEDGRFKLKLFCVNPAVNLKTYLEQGNSTIFFSATLLPIQYYKKLLSTNENDYAIYAESPFDERKRLLLIGADVSTKYTLRGLEMYRKMAKYLLEILDTKQGNYLVFFPSYRMLEEVYGEFVTLQKERREMEETEKKEVEILVQKPGMGEEEREAFLEGFEKKRAGSVLGFSVLGGIFSEGIDLSRECLIGAIIVGTGLPQVCPEREILRQYFDMNQLPGFDYAYLYPGMNKVLQAAGRVIRTDEDEGIILLLDDRFQSRQYAAVFPREWKQREYCTLETVEEHIENFWNHAIRKAPQSTT